MPRRQNVIFMFDRRTHEEYYKSVKTPDITVITGQMVKIEYYLTQTGFKTHTANGLIKLLSCCIDRRTFDDMRRYERITSPFHNHHDCQVGITV